MQCPKCHNSVQITDRFCEECGTELMVTNLSSAISNCEKCGADAEQIDQEGYCSNCGFRREERETDRIEINCSPCLAGISDRGLRHHHNQDYIAVQHIEHTDILVVCDGVSSSESPELAAKAAAVSACHSLVTAVENNIPLPAAIKQAIAAAQAAVCAVPYTTPTENSPSTTIVAAIVQNSMAVIGWLGDSRAYWISDQDSQQLTTDDSWLNDMIASGQLTEAEAIQSDKAHAITRWLGADNSDTEPSIITFPFANSGYLLLCSDGLWNYLPKSAQIAELVKLNIKSDTITISRSLVEYARHCGGHDNISVAIAKV